MGSPKAPSRAIVAAAGRRRAIPVPTFRTGTVRCTDSSKTKGGGGRELPPRRTRSPRPDPTRDRCALRGHPYRGRSGYRLGAVPQPTCGPGAARAPGSKARRAHPRRGGCPSAPREHVASRPAGVLEIASLTAGRRAELLPGRDRARPLRRHLVLRAGPLVGYRRPQNGRGRALSCGTRTERDDAHSGETAGEAR
jgi:hypothetical protein